MEKTEASKILGCAVNSPLSLINKIYSQKNEYFKKQLEDLEGLPFHYHKDRLVSEYSRLNEAYKILADGTVLADVPINPEPGTSDRGWNKFKSSADRERDKFLNSLKAIPGIVFFALIIAIVISIVFLIILLDKKFDCIKTVL